MGRKLSQETIRKIVETRRRNGSYAITPLQRQRMSDAHKGKKHPYPTRRTRADGRGFFAGKRHTLSTKLKISESRKGKYTGAHHHMYIADRTKLKRDDRRGDSAYHYWRKGVRIRDSFKCRLESDECFGRFEVHHILKWSDHPDLRYDINNGISLCQFHHPTAMDEEKRLIPLFQELVSVSKANL
jgi:hypothetical protein